MAKLVKDNKCFEDFDYEGFLEQVKRETLELTFSVGSSYITQEDINPASVLGFGTWERVKGKVLVGLDEDDENFNTIGKEGGESTHLLTIEEMPKHKNTYDKLTVQKTISNVDNTLSNGSSAISQIGTTTATTTESGGDEAHNNLQPYKVIGYMWIRTA